MKYQILFSSKNTKHISKCCLLSCLACLALKQVHCRHLSWFMHPAERVDGFTICRYVVYKIRFLYGTIIDISLF